MRIADPVLMAREVDGFVVELLRADAMGGLYVRVRVGRREYYSEPVETERKGREMVRAIRTGMSIYAQVKGGT